MGAANAEDHAVAQCERMRTRSGMTTTRRDAQTRRDRRNRGTFKAFGLRQPSFSLSASRPFLSQLCRRRGLLAWTTSYWVCLGPSLRSPLL